MGQPSTLRVLMVADSLVTGAGRAAHRLIDALKKNVPESELQVSLLSRDKRANLPTNVEFRSWNPSLSRRAAIKTFQQLANHHGSVNPRVHHSYPVIPTGGLRVISGMQTDIVNLHWLGSRLLSIQEIGRIPFPVVWTLHDEWAYRGSEHNGDDQRPFLSYQQTGPNLPGLFDADKLVWELKKAKWSRPIDFIAPSKWLADNISRSHIGSRHRVHVIPNALDLNFWQAAPREHAARLLRQAPVPQ